jgi:hypothetical protein
MEWHMCVKFCSKRGKTVKEAKQSFSQWWSRSSPKIENNVTEEQLECVYNTNCFLQLSKFGAYEFKQWINSSTWLFYGFFKKRWERNDQNLVGTQLVVSPQHCCCTCGTVCPEVSVTYNLDHSPGAIFLFPNMKGSLIRHQFESGEEIHKKRWSS